MILSGVAGWALNIDTTEKRWAWSAFFIDPTKDAAPWVIPIASLVAIVCAGLIKFTGKPWIWTTINEQLNVIRDTLFEDKITDPVHCHRVTLFRVCSRRKRLGRLDLLKRGGLILIPVARSGHMTQNPKTSFVVSRDRKAHGFAGHTWAVNRTLVVNQLPDISMKKPAKRAIVQYAKATFVDTDWVDARLKAGKPLARSMCGIPVGSGNAPWGVIVIDSIAPDGVQDEATKLYEMFGKSLGIMIKRI